MDEKYKNKLEILVEKLLLVYNESLKDSEDEYDYCTIITSVLVFKEIILSEFVKAIITTSDNDPEEICATIQKKSIEIFKSIVIKNKNQIN